MSPFCIIIPNFCTLGVCFIFWSLFKKCPTIPEFHCYLNIHKFTISATFSPESKNIARRRRLSLTTVAIDNHARPIGKRRRLSLLIKLPTNVRASNTSDNSSKISARTVSVSLQFRQTGDASNIEPPTSYVHLVFSRPALMNRYRPISRSSETT